MIEIIKKEIRDSIDLKLNLYESLAQIELIKELVEICIAGLKSGNKIIFCGNGGSFADSQHLAAEFISKLRLNRTPLAAIALGTNSSVLTAVSNDFGYENVFKRELLAIAREGDVFIPISTSGNSSNIISVIKKAKDLNLKIIGLTGESGGGMSEICKTINIPSNSTEKIQEAHIMLGHIVCALVEKNFFQK